ncbi:hypothetical protein H5410_047499 [Solanum commersonii]|uniref:ATP-dependent DNA helicase n=1 Tax=Solanum commersonii TaxID=4109 RepID=A0A9J5XFA8_SOLCO|nr:hypothetical protein H5410_047499 [Solanum commersonii]
MHPLIINLQLYLPEKHSRFCKNIANNQLWKIWDMSMNVRELEKTYLYRALLAYVRLRGTIALATTTSGVVASILPGGRTTHSRFEIPLQTIESTIYDKYVKIK